ncbi:hypothetical protein UJ101_00318 [Flavobacteriaceae bacterium UJ101]|nr:hypothetical protein UJ101_00318 [Flavobacteriaceae bacterium UJ101]
MKKILFRADASQDIGYGHVIRLLALAESLRNDFECVFVTRFLNSFIEEEINKICHKRIKLEEDETHFNQFLTMLEGDEIVVLDNYFFSTDYQQKIKKSGCKLVCIDDLADRHFVADAIINQIDITSYKSYSKESYTKLFLGLENALLRKDFLLIEQMDKKKEILIAFGGTDFNNLTYEYVKMTIDLKYHLSYKINIILNDQNEKYFDVEEFARKYENIQLYSKLSSKEVSDLMKRACSGILPSSSMCIEALALGINVVSGYYIDNQEYMFKYLNDNGYVNGYGDLNILDKDRLKIDLDECLRKDLDKSFMEKIQKSKENHKKHFVEISNT